MSGRLLLLTLLALAPLAANAQTYEVETLHENGPPERRIDITLLGDGYRAQDQVQLHDDALNLVNTLFSLTPFKEYRALFNVRLIHVVSNQNGADYGTYGTVRDTALGATFNCNNIDRLLCVNSEVVRTVAARNTPGYDLLVVVVNDPKYGGSGGDVATVSLAPAAGEIIRHELGHTLGKLADEYTTAYPGYPSCFEGGQTDCPEPNATVRRDRGLVKWASWIDPGTPVPTPSTGNAPGIGLYEGCRYQARGVYRPKDGDCLMKVLGHPYCAVCAEALVRSFWNHVSPVDTFSPTSGRAEVTPCGPLTLTVSPPFESSQWSYLWTVDGQPRASQENRLALSRDDLPEGQHEVAVVVTDTTPLVRNDPGNALKEQQTWQVRVGACTPVGPCDVSAACAGGGCARTYKEVGTPCGPPTCVGNVKHSDAACAANGECLPKQSTSCGAYMCDEATTDCRTSCTGDGHCSPGHVCRSGACQPVSEPPPNKGGLFSCLGCSNGGGAGEVALGLVALAWLATRRARPAPARVRHRGQGPKRP